MFATLLLDVEDIIAPEADDAARDVADLLSEEGLRATFCVVGERARQWERRKRTDVVAALARHDVGYHTNYHSVPPTVSQYLAPLGWHEGIEEVLKRERDGVDAVSQLFGDLPSCHGGPGNTWGPQMNAGMALLGVPACVYAHSRVPGGDVHLYCGAIAYPGGTYLGDGQYHLPDQREANTQAALRSLAGWSASGVQWAEIFTGHPTRVRHEAFWDAANFSGGANPPREQWRPAPMKSDADYAEALAGMRPAVRAVRDQSGVTLQTIREMNARFAAATPETLTPEELQVAAGELDANVAGMAGWIIVPPDLDLTRLRAVAREHVGSLRRLRLG
ncbi:MAG: hypothetical protein NT029_10165 [Armatimonadetes bacterium]|nr:hypothetical protein [Armatimonadota bacterium]